MKITKRAAIYFFAAIGTVALIALAFAFTHKPAAFNSKPSAFIEGFNRTVRGYVSQTDLEVKKYYCDSTSDSKKTCVYSGAYASMTLNVRKNGTVWRAEIRILIPKGNEEERHTYVHAVGSSCMALIEQTSGLDERGANKLWREMTHEIAEIHGGSSYREVGSIHFFLLDSMYGDDFQVFCGAASEEEEED